MITVCYFTVNERHERVPHERSFWDETAYQRWRIASGSGRFHVVGVEGSGPLPAGLCPVCGAVGGEPCVEEDGQYVLDHWGRVTPDPAVAAA